ncbi:sterol desaturase family protein [Rhabdothermincola salaria]|uniref:sterol desaturase family protein n=1 Tax=Rhabdothermincola salaria TaxID=2903142 RepID=UPI001E3A25A6|nr:sterol desaturase family protein [Rhabdothermincola salaria]
MTTAEPTEPSGTETGIRLTGRGVAVFAALAAAVVALALVVPALADRFQSANGGVLLSDVAKGWSHTVLHPAYWVFLAVLALLEWRWPARRGEGLLSTGGAQDLAWLLLAPFFTLTLVAGYVHVLDALYDGPLGGTALDVEGTLGTAVAFVLAFLLADFFMWFSHWVRHKVPPLWRFHQVHHSQRAMSALTDNRVHFFESIVSATLAYVPARLLGLGDEAALLLALGTVYFTGFTHANLRTNLGPLRYVVVTPQSHRIHHSTQEPHWDKNFGAICSIWDRLFRTQYHPADEYPGVGIDDQDFPLEHSTRPAAVLATYGRQLVYPFRKVAADLRR